MRSNLVGSAGFDSAVQQREIAVRRLETLPNFESRDGVFGLGVVGGNHLRALVKGPKQRHVDLAIVLLDVAKHQGFILPKRAVRFHGGTKSHASLISFCANHKPRSIGIQAMHNAEATVVILNVAKVLLATVSDQRVYQRAVIVAVCRMANEPRLLGNNEDVLIFVANIKGDVLGFDSKAIARLFSGNFLTLIKFVVLGLRGAIDLHLAFVTKSCSHTTGRIGI